MLDHIHMIDEHNARVLVRDIPSHVIAEHLNHPINVVTNDQGYDDPVYWVRLRLEVELVRRALGLAIR